MFICVACLGPIACFHLSLHSFSSFAARLVLCARPLLLEQSPPSHHNPRKYVARINIVGIYIDTWLHDKVSTVHECVVQCVYASSHGRTKAKIETTNWNASSHQMKTKQNIRCLTFLRGCMCKYRHHAKGPLAAQYQKIGFRRLELDSYWFVGIYIY